MDLTIHLLLSLHAEVLVDDVILTFHDHKASSLRSTKHFNSIVVLATARRNELYCLTSMLETTQMSAFSTTYVSTK